MKELKFYKKTEYERSDLPEDTNIFDGRFLFSTQNTAVYPEYSFVVTNSQIMKIHLRCDKIFYKDDMIAILRDGVLEIFDNMELKKKESLHNVETIHDFPDEKYLECTKMNKNVFIVDGEEMIITDKTVTYKGKEYPNDIYEDECEYFVGWKEKLAILGNNKSFNFMYFLDGEVIEPEEYNPLRVRTDEDTLESIPLDCIRIWKDSIFLIDNQMNNVFTVDGYDIIQNDTKPIVEYSIQDDKIVLFDGTVLFLEPAPEILPLPINEDLKNIDEKQQMMNNNELKTSIESISMKSTVNKENTVIKDAAKKEKDAVEEEISKIDRSFNVRMEKLKTGFSKIQKKKSLARSLVFVPSKFDLNGLYNTIFHDKIEEYDKVLSSMIVKLENMKLLSENNILESIKFFDSRIFVKSPLRKSVNYSAPLYRKFDEVIEISSPLNDLIEGIRVLELNEKETKLNFISNEAENRQQIKNSNPVVLNKTDLQNIDQKNFDQKNNDHKDTSVLFKEDTLKESQIVSDDISGSNKLQPNTSIQQPDIFKKELSPDIPSNSTFLNNTFQGVPQNSIHTQNSTLFGQPPQNISNGLFVNDTSSLFSNIASKPLNTVSNPFQANQQMAQDNTQKPDNTNAPVSAFNRLAGSRKLFQ